MSKHNVDGSIRIYFCRNAGNGSEIPHTLTNLGRRDDIVLEAVPCSGKVDPRYLLKAFEAGARAVCVLTCPSGHCRLMEGNLRSLGRVQAVREILSEAGVDADSVQVFVPNGKPESSLEVMVDNLAAFAEQRAQRAPEMVA